MITLALCGFCTRARSRDTVRGGATHSVMSGDCLQHLIGTNSPSSRGMLTSEMFPLSLF